MKYIRTKDGIYKVILVSPLVFVRIDKRDGTYPDVFEKDIINQADTIEGLSDAYVIVPKDKRFKPYTLNTLSGFDDIEAVLEHNDIYSSIWVDDNLVKAAKMNEKGELELL